jgi:hypothetical protein
MKNSKKRINVNFQNFCATSEYSGAAEPPFRKFGNRGIVNRVSGIFSKLLFWKFDRRRIICKKYLRGYCGQVSLKRGYDYFSAYCPAYGSA